MTFSVNSFIKLQTLTNANAWAVSCNLFKF